MEIGFVRSCSERSWRLELSTTLCMYVCVCVVTLNPNSLGTQNELITDLNLLNMHVYPNQLFDFRTKICCIINAID